MTTSPDRTATRLAWARSALAAPDLQLAPASADASFRSYWRAEHGGKSWIVMDSPPSLEDPRPWVEIGTLLDRAGLHVPRVHASDLDQGFLLIEDLGNRLYLPALDEGTADALYGDAMDALLRMQAHAPASGLAPYDRAFLVRELEIMPEWFLRKHLGHDIACESWDVLEAAFDVLVRNAAAQPQVFVHRDFHSRNLLITDERNPGVIDFQGALRGAITYDLASLLRDCYIVWDRTRVEAWAETYRNRLVDAGLISAGVSAETFRRWFDLIGLQRHIKVLGIFCRLWYRDGKSGYLQDLPRVFDYVIDVASGYPELKDLAELLLAAVGNRDLRQPVDA
ncbi:MULTISPECIES: aminoglycoside phosphotransferase family protein [Dyella]|uniref:Aminoglycoside phosphotransferase n=2 Tax=Dyella TaxID=231454 RepID=A0A4R0YYH0_9GAMM|nr:MULTISPECIES: phosphotransferase [Dyella]TBR40054.1 aminoglycoside phosphotransferase [Dyella terrae]TCI12364.1 aminoglycoside phosphotransferase [Dyella soli]